MRKALLVAAAALLAACGNDRLPNGARILVPAERGASWMAAATQNHDLLYVSDEGGSVYVFSYPAGKRLGVLTGFQGPGGLCSDAVGDVFVVDTPRQSVVEYKHGRKTPSRVVGAFGFPEGCAVDPSTGDLAVTTYQSGHSSGPGSVTVYANTKGGQSTTFTDPSFAAFYFCGYDEKGNLYVDGVNSGTSQAEFAVLPQGGTSLRDFKLDKTVGYPGGIQWDGSAVAIEDLATDVLYRVKVAGSRGRVVGETHLVGDHSTLLRQFWIQKGTIVSPYGRLARGAHKVGLWPYPSGGMAEKVLEPRGTVELLGTTVSVHS